MQATPSSIEQKIPITRLAIFPVKGITCEDEHEFLDIGPLGIKYDREIVISPRYGKAKKLSAWNTPTMEQLR
jgi:uncharacterized protein YcbX